MIFRKRLDMGRVAGGWVAGMGMVGFGVGWAAPLEIPSVWPRGSTWYADLELAAAQVGQATEGRVEIVLQEASMLEKVPELAIYTLPLFFRSEEELVYVRESLDADLVAMFAERGLVIWDLQMIGTAHLFSKVPFDSLDGFLNSKVWVPKDSHDVKYDEVGLKQPVPLDLRLLRDALRGDEVDTFALTPTGALLKRYHTRVAVVSRQPLTYVVAPLSVPAAVLAQLSPEDQELTKAKMVEAFGRAARTNRDKDAEAMRLFESRGELTVSDAIDFRQETWQDWAEKVRVRLVRDDIIPQHIFDKVQTLLKEYRAARQGTE